MISFKSVAHFLATVSHDVLVGARAVEHALAANEQKIDKTIELAAQIVSAVDPALAPVASLVQRGAEAALGEVLSAIAKADAAAEQDGLNVTLDAETVKEFKALFAQLSPTIRVKLQQAVLQGIPK